MSSKAEVASFRDKFIASARKFKLFQDAEDLAHDALVKWLGGGGVGQTVDQAMIDSIRSHYGSERASGHEMRKALEQSTVGLKALLLFNSKEPLPDRLIDFENLVRSLDRDRRIVLHLYYVWGLSYVEIGRVMGVSGSRVCQMHNEGIEILGRRDEECEGA